MSLQLKTDIVADVNKYERVFFFLTGQLKGGKGPLGALRKCSNQLEIIGFPGMEKTEKSASLPYGPINHERKKEAKKETS